MGNKNVPKKQWLIMTLSATYIYNALNVLQTRYFYVYFELKPFLSALFGIGVRNKPLMY